MLVKIFTDGAARGNPDGPGGYGTVLEYVDTKGQLHTREFSCGYVKTTNNRMELMAAIVGLEALNRPCQVELYSDSKYVVDAFNQNWIDSWIKKGWKRGKNEPVKDRHKLGPLGIFFRSQGLRCHTVDQTLRDCPADAVQCIAADLSCIGKQRQVSANYRRNI